MCLHWVHHLDAFIAWSRVNDLQLGGWRSCRSLVPSLVQKQPFTHFFFFLKFPFCLEMSLLHFNHRMAPLLWSVRLPVLNESKTDSLVSLPLPWTQVVVGFRGRIRGEGERMCSEKVYERRCPSPPLDYSSIDWQVALFPFQQALWICFFVCVLFCFCLFFVCLIFYLFSA